MTLTLGTGPFGPQANGTFNFRREGPRHVLYWEDYLPRIRAIVGGETVVDSRRVKLLHETGHLPVLYFPREDVRWDLLGAGDRTTHCPFKGDASYWSIRVGDRVAEDAVWGYPDPIEGAPPIAGHVALYHGAADTWLEEDEEVYAHPRDPYHRVTVRRGSGHVVVRVGDEVVADSRAPQVLFETGLPVRYYLPPDDVRTDLLARSDTVSRCPYKGDGQHWHVEAGGRRIEDAAWSLPAPLAEAAQAGGHMCFSADGVSVEVDGEPVG